MKLHEALSQIAEIRLQMAQAEAVRDCRSTPVAVSGCLALVAAAVQPWIITNPATDFGGYLTLWIAVAMLSVSAVTLEMCFRRFHLRDSAPLGPTRLALEQFLPPLLAGGVVTLLITRHFPEAIGLIPALWQLLFGLGVFASARLLPREIRLVAVFYFCCGLALFLVARDFRSLSPWCMGIPFGVGQLSAAAVLYWKLER